MFNSFKDCVIANLAECSIEIKGGVYFTVEQNMEKTFEACANDVTVDFPSLL